MKQQVTICFLEGGIEAPHFTLICPVLVPVRPVSISVVKTVRLTLYPYITSVCMDYSIKSGFWGHLTFIPSSSQCPPFLSTRNQFQKDASK